jgi:hypothetical protein
MQPNHNTWFPDHYIPDKDFSTVFGGAPQPQPTRHPEPNANSTTTAPQAAIKHDQDKVPLHLLSTTALLEVGKVLQFGAQKYAAHNWRGGFQWSRPTAAAMRHILAWNNGEDLDPESQLSHLAHAMCCLMFLLEFQKTHPHLDDRYKPNV